MTLNEFKDFYYNVCNVDYNKMKIAMEPLKELMNKTDKVHIVAPETDLTFSIKGIPAKKYYSVYTKIEIKDHGIGINKMEHLIYQMVKPQHVQ